MKAIKKILCVSLVILSLTGCGKTPELSDGSDLLFEMNGLNMTVDEFYEKLKTSYGTYALINSIDEELLNSVYETDKDMSTKIDSTITSLKSQFGSDFDTAISQYYGVSSEKELRNYIEVAYKRENAAKDYAATLITDEDIEKYYEEKTIGDMKVSHILITSDASSDATSEEKEEAENKALEKAKELIKKLDEGANFEELAKENSADSSASDGGNIGYFNRGTTVSEFEEASVKLNVGEYTKEPVKTQYGYHIILKTDQKEKPAYDEVKDSIKDTLVEEKISNTDNIYVYAMEWLRNKYNLKIYDAELKIKYDHYMNEQKASSTSTN